MQDTIATITIDRLRLHCNHGVLEQERLVGNEFDVSVVFDYDASMAVLSDNIFSAISYTEVIDVIRRTMQTPSSLLEHVAGRVIDALATAFPSIILSITVSITKIAPPIPVQMQGVTVSISRKLHE